MNPGMGTADDVCAPAPTDLLDLLDGMREMARSRSFGVARERDLACVRHGYLLAIDEIEKALERRVEA